MEAVVLRRGPLRIRDAAVRVLASLGVIGTGGSVGREGPIVELGATLGSRIGSLAGRPVEAVPLFIACGAAAGMAAAYRAPLGASVFVVEVMLGSFAVRRLAPVVVASVAAATVVRAVAGPEPVYRIPELHLASWWELALVALVGILGGVAGPLFLRVLALGEEAFGRMPAIPGLRAAVGGLLVGAVGIGFPQVMGNGFDAVNLILAGRMGLLLMAALLLLKALATAATVGSGGLGGVFTPTLFLGAAMGGLLGTAVHAAAPGATGTPATYGLLGMAAFIGATTHAPVTAVLMLFELTRDYELVPALMLAAVLATVLARHLHPWSHYTQRLHRRGVVLPGSPAEAELAATPALAAMVPAARTVGAAAPVAEVLRRIREEEGDLFVVGPDGSLRGRIRAEDLAGVDASDLRGIAVADDLAVPAPAVAPEASLAEALLALDGADLEAIPVAAGGGAGRIVGILTRRAILERVRRIGSGHDA